VAGGAGVDRGVVSQKTPHKMDVIPGGCDVEGGKALPVGEIWVCSFDEEIFGDLRLAVTDSVHEGGVVVDGIPGIDLCPVLHEDHGRLEVVIGGRHMKRRDVLAVDVRIRPGFEEDPQDLRMMVGDSTAERRAILKVGPVVDPFDVPGHAIDITVFAGFEEPPPGDGFRAFEVRHTRSLPHPVKGRQMYSTSRHERGLDTHRS